MYQTNQEMPQNLQEKKPHNVLMVILYFFSMFILTSIPRMAVIMQQKSKGITDTAQIDKDLLNRSSVYGLILAYAVVAVCVIVFYHRTIKNEFKKNKSFLSWLGTSVVGYIITYLISFASMIIIICIKNGETTANQQGINMGYQMAMPIILKAMYLLSIMIVAPFAEEIIFRFILQNWIEKQCKKLIGTKISAAIAIICSGFIFGFIHTFKLSIDLIAYFPMGMFFGFMYRRKKNLSHSIGIHALNNTVSTVLSMLFQTIV